MGKFFLFYSSSQPEHKIQSAADLSITMRQVPKLLSPLVREWAPNAFTVSFKVSAQSLLNVCVHTSNFGLQLETNEKLLISRAKQAIERYQHQVCIVCVCVCVCVCVW